MDELSALHFLSANFCPNIDSNIPPQQTRTSSSTAQAHNTSTKDVWSSWAVWDGHREVQGGQIVALGWAEIEGADWGAETAWEAGRGVDPESDGNVVDGLWIVTYVKQEEGEGN